MGLFFLLMAGYPSASRVILASGVEGTTFCQSAEEPLKNYIPTGQTDFCTSVPRPTQKEKRLRRENTAQGIFSVVDLVVKILTRRLDPFR